MLCEWHINARRAGQWKGFQNLTSIFDLDRQRPLVPVDLIYLHMSILPFTVTKLKRNVEFRVNLRADDPGIFKVIQKKISHACTSWRLII